MCGPSLRVAELLKAEADTMHASQQELRQDLSASSASQRRVVKQRVTEVFAELQQRNPNLIASAGLGDENSCGHARDMQGRPAEWQPCRSCQRLLCASCRTWSGYCHNTAICMAHAGKGGKNVARAAMGLQPVSGKAGSWWLQGHSTAELLTMYDQALEDPRMKCIRPYLETGMARSWYDAYKI